MTQLGKCRVLVVDDDEQIAHVMAAVVRGSCDEVVVVGTFRAAMRAVAEESFSLVLLDLMLPDSAVWQTIRCAILLKGSPETRIVCVTGGRPDKFVIDFAHDNGVENIIVKGASEFAHRLRTLFDEVPDELAAGPAV